MNTRKKCNACGLIAFASDEVCKRCGSDKLFGYQMPEALPVTTNLSTEKSLPFWNYIVCFVLACVFECVAIFPVLANIGFRHSANAPVSDYERNSAVVAFILHLPTSAIAYISVHLDGGLLFLLTPFIQIIFWTFMFSKLWRRIKGLNKLK